MGFGSVVAMVMFFIGVILVAGTWLDISQSNFETQVVNSDLRIGLIKSEMFSDLVFMNLSYNSNTSEVSLQLQNTGKTKFLLEDTQVFKNGVRISPSSFTIVIDESTDLGNALIWDPAEQVRITIVDSITAEFTKYRVVTTYGAFAESILVADLADLDNSAPEFVFDLFDVSRSSGYPSTHTLYSISDLEAFVYDADEDELTFSIDSQTNSAQLPCTITGGGLICSPQPDVTSATNSITVRVSDPYGAFDTSTFTFTLNV